MQYFTVKLVKKTVKSLLLRIMLLKSYKQNRLIAQTVTAILFIVLCVTMFLQLKEGVRFSPLNNTPLSNWLLNTINSWNFNAGAIIISCVLLGIETVVAVTINERFELCNVKYPLFATVYFLLSLSYAPSAVLLPQQVANIFIGMGIYKIFSSYGWNDAGYKAFDAGLYLGVALLFSFNVLAIFILGLIALIIFRPYKVREATLLILGSITPIIFYFAIHYIISQSYSEIVDFLLSWINFHKTVVLTQKDYTYIAIISVIGLFGFFNAISQRNQMNVMGSKAFLTFLIMILTVVLSVVFFPFIEIMDLRLAVIPATFILVNMFNSLRDNWISEVVFIVFIITLLAMPFMWIV